VATAGEEAEEHRNTEHPQHQHLGHAGNMQEMVPQATKYSARKESKMRERDRLRSDNNEQASCGYQNEKGPQGFERRVVRAPQRRQRKHHALCPQQNVRTTRPSAKGAVRKVSKPAIE
jgi:hypothetical protein